VDHDVRGQDVVVVAAVVDTGLTLGMVLDALRLRAPRSLRSCVLLQKRRERGVGLRVDYVAFEVAPVLVVGYGLDAGERYRQLPVVGTLT
jgi:hypoxanthine phosphoribosyltransferase